MRIGGRGGPGAGLAKGCRGRITRSGGRRKHYVSFIEFDQLPNSSIFVLQKKENPRKTNISALRKPERVQETYYITLL